MLIDIIIPDHVPARDPELETTSKKSVDEWDVTPLRNHARFERAYTALPFDLKIEVIASEDGRRSVGHKPGTPDIVTYKAVINMGNDLIPLTPWIVLHRLVHLDAVKVDEQVAQVFTDLFADAGIPHTVHAQMGMYVQMPNRYSGPSGEETCLKEVSRFLTMRSARTGNLTTGLDITPELFAQWGLRGGSVKLRQPEDTKPVDLAVYEARLNAIMAELANLLVGRTVSF